MHLVPGARLDEVPRDAVIAPHGHKSRRLNEESHADFIKRCGNNRSVAATAARIYHAEEFEGVAHVGALKAGVLCKWDLTLRPYETTGVASRGTAKEMRAVYMRGEHLIANTKLIHRAMVAHEQLVGRKPTSTETFLLNDDSLLTFGQIIEPLAIHYSAVEVKNHPSSVVLRNCLSVKHLQTKEGVDVHAVDVLSLSPQKPRKVGPNGDWRSYEGRVFFDPTMNVDGYMTKIVKVIESMTNVPSRVQEWVRMSGGHMKSRVQVDESLALLRDALLGRPTTLEMLFSVDEMLGKSAVRIKLGFLVPVSASGKNPFGTKTVRELIMFVNDQSIEWALRKTTWLRLFNCNLLKDGKAVVEVDARGNILDQKRIKDLAKVRGTLSRDRYETLEEVRIRLIKGGIEMNPGPALDPQSPLEVLVAELTAGITRRTPPLTVMEGGQHITEVTVNADGSFTLLVPEQVAPNTWVDRRRTFSGYFNGMIGGKRIVALSVMSLELAMAAHNRLLTQGIEPNPGPNRVCITNGGTTVIVYANETPIHSVARVGDSVHLYDAEGRECGPKLDATSRLYWIGFVGAHQHAIRIMRSVAESDFNRLLAQGVEPNPGPYQVRFAERLRSLYNSAPSGHVPAPLLVARLHEMILNFTDASLNVFVNTPGAREALHAYIDGSPRTAMVELHLGDVWDRAHPPQMERNETASFNGSESSNGQPGAADEDASTAAGPAQRLAPEFPFADIAETASVGSSSHASTPPPRVRVPLPGAPPPERFAEAGELPEFAGHYEIVIEGVNAAVELVTDAFHAISNVLPHPPAQGAVAEVVPAAQREPDFGNQEGVPPPEAVRAGISGRRARIAAVTAIALMCVTVANLATGVTASVTLSEGNHILARSNITIAEQDVFEPLRQRAVNWIANITVPTLPAQVETTIEVPWFLLAWAWRLIAVLAFLGITQRVVKPDARNAQALDMGAPVGKMRLYSYATTGDENQPLCHSAKLASTCRSMFGWHVAQTSKRDARAANLSVAALIDTVPGPVVRSTAYDKVPEGPAATCEFELHKFDITPIRTVYGLLAFVVLYPAGLVFALAATAAVCWCLRGKVLMKRVLIHRGRVNAARVREVRTQCTSLGPGFVRGLENLVRHGNYVSGDGWRNEGPETVEVLKLIALHTLCQAADLQDRHLNVRAAEPPARPSV